MVRVAVPTENAFLEKAEVGVALRDCEEGTRKIVKRFVCLQFACLRVRMEVCILSWQRRCYMVSLVKVFRVIGCVAFVLVWCPGWCPQVSSMVSSMSGHLCLFARSMAL